MKWLKFYISSSSSFRDAIFCRVVFRGYYSSGTRTNSLGFHLTLKQ